MRTSPFPPPVGLWGGMNDREKDLGISVKAGRVWLWENELRSPEASEEDHGPRAGCCADSTKEERICFSLSLFKYSYLGCIAS